MTDIIERLQAYIDDNCALNAEKIEKLGEEALFAVGFAGKRNDMGTAETILTLLCGLETDGAALPLQRIQSRAAGYRDAFLQFCRGENGGGSVSGAPSEETVSAASETQSLPVNKGDRFQADSGFKESAPAEPWRPRPLGADEFF